MAASSTMSPSLSPPSLLLLWLLLLPLIPVSAGEWYQECTGNSCGYGASTRGNTKSNCQDLNPSCPEYARRGECFANPRWMLENCIFSCGACHDNDDQNDEDDDDDECVDLHSHCPQWADQLECFTNPGYTHRACQKSCWLCVDVEELRHPEEDDERMTAETEIQHRIRYSQTDWGVWQAWNGQKDSSITSGGANEPTPAQVKDRIIRMGQYQHSLKHIGRGTVCNNLKHDCAKWATITKNPDGSIKDECRNNIMFMLESCSLACEYCSVVEAFHTCRPLLKDARQPQNHVFFGQPESTLKSIYEHLSKDLAAVDLLSRHDESKTCDSEVLNGGGNIPDEWVLSFNRTSIWDGEGGGQKLLEFLKSLPNRLWFDSMSLASSNGEDNNDDHHHHNGAAIMAVTPHRSGLVLGLSTLSSLSDVDLAVVDEFRSTISVLLQVPTTHLEFEFVRYKRGERYLSHADSNLHDVWKHSGSRLLSMYVVLEKPIEGGNVGFPDLDWLIIEEPQVLVWPNVEMRDSAAAASFPVPLSRMKNEQLPVEEGEMFAARIWVREYKYDESNFCA